jgi:hypothetical protein
MKLGIDPFPVGMVNLEEKKIPVSSDQEDTTQGKNVVVSDELRHWMIVPCNPEVGAWKENVRRKTARRVKPTSSMLMEKISKAAARQVVQQVAQETKVTGLWDG